MRFVSTLESLKLAQLKKPIDSHMQATALALVYQDGYKVRAVSPGERVADGD